MSKDKQQADSLDWIKGESAESTEAAVEVSGDLSLEGSLGIAEADTVYQSLLALLDAQVDVCISSENLSRVDAAGAQLLYAFMKEAETRSIKVTWKSVSDALRETVATLGLSDNMGFEVAGA